MHWKLFAPLRCVNWLRSLLNYYIAYCADIRHSSRRRVVGTRGRHIQPVRQQGVLTTRRRRHQVQTMRSRPRRHLQAPVAEARPTAGPDEAQLVPRSTPRTTPPTMSKRFAFLPSTLKLHLRGRVCSQGGFSYSPVTRNRTRKTLQSKDVTTGCDFRFWYA